ncbi:MAG: hypothetical protein NC131_17255 [Roseburia sp.]|nr:hypothetical protein [Roseburia sp.]
MAKSIVVVSGYVDTTIRETQKDVNFFLFKTLEELDQFIEKTPIRGDTLFFSRDTIPLVNTSLNYLVTIMEKVFFRVDHVVYITEPGSQEIESIKFLVKSKEYDNWEIIQGALTREYVTGVVNGSARTDFSSTKRKAVYRIPKDAYIRNKTRNSKLLEEERYKDDDEQIQEMPDEKPPVYIPPEREQTCVAYDIVGNDIDERTLFVFIMAQYLATHGKTLLLERDCEYHKLGEYVTKSGVECGIFYVDDLFDNPQKTLEDIRRSKNKLVVCLCRRRIKYNYSFVFNILYNNLINTFAYMIRESGFGEEPTESKYTVVFPNTMCGTLSMCGKINMNFIPHTKFVAVHTDTLREVRLPTRESISAIIEDVLNEQKIQPVELIAITSLVMGQESNYDLRSVLWN